MGKRLRPQDINCRIVKKERSGRPARSKWPAAVRIIVGTILILLACSLWMALHEGF